MENNERREFLKKIAYKAPAVIALGTLMAPASANATNIVTPPNGDNSDDDTFDSKNGGLG
jgi:hypothetical protein